MAPKINITNSKIVFRNLAGKPTKFNSRGGVRDFAVVLDNYDDVESLINMGFSVKYFNKKNENDPDVPFLKVKVNFRYNEEGELMSPHIYVINNGQKVLIKPETAEIVDRADIAYCDMVIRPFAYNNINGRSGVSAYLDKMFVNIEEDEIEKKYEMYNDPDEEAEGEEIPFE